MNEFTLQLQNKETMLLTFGSAFAFIVGVFVCCKSRKNWSLIVNEFIYAMRYNVLGVTGVINDFLQAKQNKTDLPKKTGKVAVVTGGSRGIGAMVVKMLLQCDMEVIIACRKTAAGDKTIRQIRDAGITGGVAKVYELDNSDLESVRRLAERIKKDYTKIDILINNAGIMFTPYSETKDGFEQQWAVNYLSHFLLASLLLPLLKAAGSSNESARIVNVASCAHLVGTINFDDINYKKQFITSAAYGQSKLAQVMFTKTLQDLLAKRHYNIQVYSVHPGVVNTDLFEHTFLRKYFQWLSDLVFKTPVQGATSIVYAAVSKSVEGRGGMYISNCSESPVNPKVADSAIRDQLFQLSLEQVQLKDFFQES